MMTGSLRLPPKRKGGESDDEPEPAKGSGYTSEDQALFSAEDLGRKKLLDMCGVKSSLAHEIKLRAEGKSEVQVAKEFDRMVKNTPPLPSEPGDRGNHVQKRLDAFPAEYFLMFLPQENRVHVATQLTRFYDEEEKSEGDGHLLAYVGEINIVSGLPQLMMLRGTEKEKELFCYVPYSKQNLLKGDEADEFLSDEANLGKFSVARNLRGGRPAKKRKGDTCIETPLLLRVPANYAMLFLDSPVLGVAWSRAQEMIQNVLPDECQGLVAPLLDFIAMGAHSRDGIHSVLVSDWEAMESEEISQWMAPRMTMRLV